MESCGEATSSVPSLSNHETTADMESEPSVQQSPESLSDRDVNDLFYFESDHLALRDNSDYKRLTRAVAILEAQRSQALQDLDSLIKLKQQAISNPIDFVDKLQHKVDLGIPAPIKISALPYIPWENYTSIEGTPAAAGVNTRAKTEQYIKSEPLAPGLGNSVGTNATVRGRVKDQSKPLSFNLLWSVDEQKRLEELLIEYPPEDVEAHRWAKIAKALGNRTSLQVASRVQKYFIKLAKAGLPIPGRLPNVSMYKSGRKTHKHQKHNHFYHQPSTFLQAYEPPVFMEDDDENLHQATIGYREAVATAHPASNGSICSEQFVISDEEDVPVELRNTPEYRSIMQLKKERMLAVKSSTCHDGFKCDVCEMEPIQGTRWHCVDCPTAVSTDFCDKCMDVGYTSEVHLSSHRLEPLDPTGGEDNHQSTHTQVDSDYVQAMPGQYSYLDPNYMPATVATSDSTSASTADTTHTT